MVPLKYILGDVRIRPPFSGVECNYVHTVKLTKNGYELWERKITTLAGSLTISPELEPLTRW